MLQSFCLVIGDKAFYGHKDSLFILNSKEKCQKMRRIAEMSAVCSVSL
jgi:hypothetical protein